MKIILGYITSMLIFLLWVPQAFALKLPCLPDNSPCPTPDTSMQLSQSQIYQHQVLGFIITILFVIGFFLAISFIILGIIKWIISRKDKERRKKARKMIFIAIIGLIGIYLIFFILNLVLTLSELRPI